MTTVSTRRDRLRQPWLIRRIIYIVAGAVGVVAAVFFGATADHLDAIDRALGTVTPIILALVSTLAAPKANPGADAGGSAPAAAEPDLAGSIADLVEEAVGRAIPAGQHRADASDTLDSLRNHMAVEG